MLLVMLGACGGEKTGAEPSTGQGDEGAKPVRETPEATSITRSWNDYRHPEGFTFRYPASWTLREGDEAVVLIPQDAEKDDKGRPVELFLVGGHEAEGLRRAADPAVGRFFAQQFPKLSPVGKTTAMSTGLGTGAVFRFRGEVDGQQIVAVAYVALHDETGLFLTHMAPASSAERRRSTAEKIFASFAWGAAALDPDLVGSWTRTRSSSSDVTDSGYIGSSTTRTWTFAADGRFAYGSASRMFGHVEGGGGQVTLDPSATSGDVQRGRWHVNGDRLELVWADGSEDTYLYSVFPHTENRVALKLTLPGEKKGDFYIRQ